MASRVTLREVLESDLPILFEHQLDPIATRMVAFDARPWNAFVEHWKKILAEAENRLRTVLVDDRVAGNVVAWSAGDERLIGYWIGREFWGAGIASRALAQFVELEATRPLFAHVAQHNLGSIRVLEKCGFTRIASRTGEPCGASGEVEEFAYELAAPR